MTATTREQAGEYVLLPVNPDDETLMNLCLHLVGEGGTLGVAMERYRALCDALTPTADHSAHDLNMVRVPRDLHLITLGMLSSYVTTLAGIDFPDNDEGDYRQRLNETKRVAVNSTIAKLRALIVSADMLEKSRAALSPAADQYRLDVARALDLTGDHEWPSLLAAIKTAAKLAQSDALSPAGGGVVMPERKSGAATIQGLHERRGWNACLDEFARLNAKPQANSQEGE